MLVHGMTDETPIQINQTSLLLLSNKHDKGKLPIRHDNIHAKSVVLLDTRSRVCVMFGIVKTVYVFVFASSEPMSVI